MIIHNSPNLQTNRKIKSSNDMEFSEEKKSERSMKGGEDLSNRQSIQLYSTKINDNRRRLKEYNHLQDHNKLVKVNTTYIDEARLEKNFEEI